MPANFDRSRREICGNFEPIRGVCGDERAGVKSRGYTCLGSALSYVYILSRRCDELCSYVFFSL